MTLILHLWLGEWIVSFQTAKLQGYVFDNFVVDENGELRVVLTRKVLDDFNITDAESCYCWNSWPD